MQASHSISRLLVDRTFQYDSHKFVDRCCRHDKCDGAQYYSDERQEQLTISADSNSFSNYILINLHHSNIGAIEFRRLIRLDITLILVTGCKNGCECFVIIEGKGEIANQICDSFSQIR